MSKIIDPDIKGTVEKLDQRIAKLRLIREMLLEEYSFDDSTGLPPVRKPPAEETAGKTRKQMIAEFLLKNGATQRKDIVAGTGIPIGSVSFALNDKQMFHSVNEQWGKWDVVESLKTAR